MGKSSCLPRRRRTSSVDTAALLGSPCLSITGKAAIAGVRTQEAAPRIKHARVVAMATGAECRPRSVAFSFQPGTHVGCRSFWSRRGGVPVPCMIHAPVARPVAPCIRTGRSGAPFVRPGCVYPLVLVPSLCRPFPRGHARVCIWTTLSVVWIDIDVPQTCIVVRTCIRMRAHALALRKRRCP